YILLDSPQNLLADFGLAEKIQNCEAVFAN
ncbi:MAG: hypothetical protein ACJA1Z_003423, partial [Patiriisocius sp.]